MLNKHDATQLNLSNIPAGLEPDAYLVFNQTGYQKYCQDYMSYWQWVKNRNETCYQATLGHEQSYDSKNMMHTIRLLQIALEIAETGQFCVHRPNREELLSIKMGEKSYEDIINLSTTLCTQIDKAFANSSLPKHPDESKAINTLVNIRQSLYA